MYIGGAEVEAGEQLQAPGNQCHSEAVVVTKVSQIMVSSHRGAIESILMGHITHWDVWCRAQERKHCAISFLSSFHPAALKKNNNNKDASVSAAAQPGYRGVSVLKL